MDLRLVATRITSRVVPLGALALVFGNLVAPHTGFAADAGQRHQYVRANGLPAPYAAPPNPLQSNEVNLAGGAATYQTNCKSCHGASGKGDGENGFYYNPKPSDLTLWAASGDTPIDEVISSDQYLFWVISEGGADLFETSMAAFKLQLSETERWQLVLFIRQGL
ncbi:MAG: cytochrome c [Fimbriimonadaceae bacterium]|nr:cytochrome c [Alphaproteobacteria bacterium]